MVVIFALVRAATWLAGVLLLLASMRGVHAFDLGLGDSRVAETPLEVTQTADAVSPLELPLMDILKNVAISDPQKRHIKRLLDAQESYDFNAKLSTVDILKRSGFHYELHNCTSVDGYQTELVRIVNPYVDRKHLRKIPVVLYTGQGTSPAAFLAASLGSQRPARWVPDDHDQHDEHHHHHHHHEDDQHHEHHLKQEHPVVDEHHHLEHHELPLEHNEEHHSGDHQEEHHDHHELTPVEHHSEHHVEQHLDHSLPIEHHDVEQHHDEHHDEHLPGEYREDHYTGGSTGSEHEIHHEQLRRRRRSAENVLPSDHLHSHLLGENNRSLAAVLANQGYDVWIVPTRGVDKQNRRRIESENSRSVKKILDNKLTLLKNMLPAQPMGSSKEEVVESQPILAKLRSFVKSFTQHDYWSFSSDEIIEFELEIQLERVRLATKREKISLITYSNGGFITFAFLAAHPGYALKHLDVVLNLAPAVFVNKLNLAYGLSGLLSHLTPPNSAFPEETVHGLVHSGFVQLCRSKAIRYSLCKLLLDQLYGPSDDMYRTHLELGLFDYIGRPLSAQGLRQTLQASYEGELIHYDYGLVGNLLFYEQLTAPDYELRRVDHPRIYILAGERDSIVDEGSLERLVSEMGTKPAKVIKIPGYNHLDLLAAHDNALRVNTPILQILNDRYLEIDYYVEEGGKFGAEELVRDIEHNRLNANDTGHMPDYSHYHVQDGAAGEQQHHLDEVVHVDQAAAAAAGHREGFKVDESRVVHDEFELDSDGRDDKNTTGLEVAADQRGQSTLPAGRLSAGAAAAAATAADSPVSIQQEQEASLVPAALQFARLAREAQAAQVASPQLVAQTGEQEHLQTIAAALQLLQEHDKQASPEVVQQQQLQGQAESHEHEDNHGVEATA